MPVVDANSEDPDQTLHFVVSDLGLHCLPITLLGVSPLKVNSESKTHVGHCFLHITESNI